MRRLLVPARALLSMALLILMQATSTAAAADDLSKPIRVSVDGRYLATADGQPLLSLADTAWPMFVRLDRQEADRYLQDRAAPEESADNSMATSVRGTVISDQVRHLPFEGAANFRDLGGYVAAGGRRIRQGLLYRSDALDSLSAVDMKLLAQLNIGRITDFRSAGEVEKRPDHLPAELEARYIHMPLEDPLAANRSQRANENGAAGAEFRRALSLTNDEEKVAIIDRLIVDHYYPRLGRDGRAAYSRWLRGLLDTPKGSAQVFHCTGGADRTGFAAAILLFALGVPKEQILDDYLLTNRYFFSPRGLALLESKGMPAMPSSYRLSARYLEASFKAIENDYGSLDNYLRQGLGIDDETRRELRDRYLESPAPRDSGALQRFQQGSPIVIAHRACWRGGPENSLSSLESCMAEGIDAAEIDIRLTKDNQLILLHDDDLSRTTSASGPVGTFSLAELRHAKLRSGKGGAASRLTNEGLPTFAEALRVAKGRLILFLDIKCGGCAEMVANVVEAEGARDWVIFIGGMENRHLAQTQWVREQTLTWISDCQLRALLTANTRCASSFIEGYDNRPATMGRTFLVLSQEDARFLGGVAENPALRQVGIVAGENATSESQLHQHELLTELRTQWQLLLEGGVTAIITDYPVELHQILGNAAVQVHRE